MSLAAALLLGVASVALAQNDSPAASAAPTPHFEQPGPPYPEAALPTHDSGTVTLRVTYPKDGLPLNVEIANSSGSALLDNSAADFVRSHWRSHGLSAVLTHDTKINFYPPPDPTAPVSFTEFPEGMTLDERKNVLFWRAVPSVSSMIVDQKIDGAIARAREVVSAYAKLDTRDFSAPVSVLQGVLTNFATIVETHEVGVVVARNDGGEPNVLTLSVPPERVPGIVRLLQKATTAATADLRAAAVSLNPPQTSEETATLAIALRKLDADVTGLVVKALAAPPPSVASPSPADATRR
ncbi:MAG: TonB family protein [Verrucomicrobia bacterium]|nr:TonB family protein [Verrucomicrobiota bacterium]